MFGKMKKKIALIITTLIIVLPYISCIFLSIYETKNDVVYNNLGIRFFDDRYNNIKMKYGIPIKLSKKTIPIKLSKTYENYCWYFLDYDGISFTLECPPNETDINNAYITRINIKNTKYPIEKFYVGKNIGKDNTNNNYLYFYDSIVLQVYVDEKLCISEMELRSRNDV